MVANLMLPNGMSCIMFLGLPLIWAAAPTIPAIAWPVIAFIALVAGAVTAHAIFA